MMYATTLPVSGLQRVLDQMFEDTAGRAQARRNEWTPAVDIRETDKELTFAVELPGIKLEDVEVTVTDGILTISGARTEEHKEGEDGRNHLVERSYGSFLRRFQLPEGVDNEKIEADCDQGMLRVRITKPALPQPKKIQIKGGTHAEPIAAQETRPSTPTAPLDGGKRAPQAIGRGESRQDTPKKVTAAHQPN